MNNLKKYKNLYLSIFSGLMTALSFVVPSFGFLMWFSLVSFCYVCFFENCGIKKTFLYGFSFGFSFYFPLCTWLYTLSSLEFINKWILCAGLSIALLLIAVIMAMGYAVVAVVFKKIKSTDALNPFLFASVWILLEFCHRMGEFGFTWGNVALTQYKYLPVIKSASLFGSLFISFVLVIFNCFVALGVKNFKNKKKALLSFLVATMFFALNIIVGVCSPEMEKGDNLTSASVCSNENPFGTVDTQHNRSIFEKMITESKKYDTDIILWSETSLALIVEDGSMYDTDFCNFTREKGCVLGVGCYRKEDGNLYTSVILYENGKKTGYIDKRHTVPFGEYIPFGKIIRNTLPFVNDIFPEENEIKSYEETVVTKTSVGKLGGFICYDSTFPALARSSTKNGAEILLMSTNDSWFYGSHAIENHLSQSVFRAVENGRYIIRCANKGVSCIITPDGKITSRGKNMALSTQGEAFKINTFTFYTCVGDIIVYFALIFLLCMVFIKWRKKQFLA